MANVMACGWQSLRLCRHCLFWILNCPVPRTAAPLVCRVWVGWPGLEGEWVPGAKRLEVLGNLGQKMLPISCFNFSSAKLGASLP